MYPPPRNMSIWVAEFEFDDDNLDELWDHQITDEDVFSVHERGDTIFLRNKNNEAGTHKMVGRDANGRLLTIILKPISRREGIWRPVTGYLSNSYEERKWKDQ